MRGFFLAAGISLSGVALAGDGILGTKASPAVGPMQADTGSVGIMSFVQMMAALAIVLVLLKFVMPKIVTKLNKKIVTKDGSSIQIEESAAFAGGSLYVVKAKSKTLLLSVTAQGVSFLSDLTERQAEHELPTFQEIVDREIAGPIQPLAVIEADETNVTMPETKNAAAALERLKRLAG
jgi:flagellar biogenesis protein FliO